MASDPAQRLRRLLRDPETSTDKFFSNERIDELVADNVDIYAAAAEGWLERAADVADAIDVSENGSDRKLSQMHKQALKMADFYMKLSLELGREEVRVSPGMVGEPFSLRDIENDDIEYLWPWSKQKMPILDDSP